VNELLEIEKDRYCGDTNTIGKTCAKVKSSLYREKTKTFIIFCEIGAFSPLFRVVFAFYRKLIFVKNKKFREKCCEVFFGWKP